MLGIIIDNKRNFKSDLKRYAKASVHSQEYQN